MKFRITLLWCCLLTFGDHVLATALQVDSVPSTWVVGGSMHYGFIIPHAEDLKAVSQGYPWGFEVSASRLSITRKAWDVCNCYAHVGFSFNYFNYDNPKELGNSYNLVLYGEPFLNYNQRWLLTLRGGMGVSWLDKVYHEVTNPRNTFYSAPLSFILLMKLSLQYGLSDRTFLNVSANYNHISNSGYRLPNRGINFPTVSAGVVHRLMPVATVRGNRISFSEESKWIKTIRLFGNIRTIPADAQFGEAWKIMAGVEGGLVRRITRINGLVASLEMSYDGLYREKARRWQTNHDHHVISLLAGHTFIFGRFNFSQQFGYYLYRPFPANKHSFFQSYAVHYRIGKIFSIGASLKAHGHVAEYMDTRFGIMF